MAIATIAFLRKLQIFSCNTQQTNRHAIRYPLHQQSAKVYDQACESKIGALGGTTHLWQLRNKDKKVFAAKIMNYKNVKNSTGIIAAIAGLLFALLYTGLEILTENPEATHSISIWHTPLIWLLAGILFYSVFYAVGIVRGGKIKERTVTFSISVAVAALLALFWLYPMLASLIGCFSGSGC